jgi:DNA-binding transcriptional LysR family regulator
MELRHLRYFLAVARARNFTRAADALGIGQPPLSQQIKSLEEELGLQLFRRTAYGAELTPAGQVFEDEAKRVLEGADRAVLAAQRAERGETGYLRVGFTCTATFNPNVSDLIRKFQVTFPNAELSVLEGTCGALFQALEEASLDVAIVRPEPRIADSICVQPWRKEPMLVALPAGDPLTSRRRVELCDLACEAFVQITREADSVLFDNIVAACSEAGFEPRMSLAAPQIALAITLVAAGLGISIVPSAIAQVQMKGVVYRPLRARGLNAQLWLAFRRDDTAAVVRNFLELA